MTRSQIERDEMRMALARASATESISRKLGDELIDAARETVAAWHERRNTEDRMTRAIERLTELVGKP
jgi:ribosomal protein S7